MLRRLDAVNVVTYLLLDVIEEMRLLQPSSSIQVSKKNPDQFIKRAARIRAPALASRGLYTVTDRPELISRVSVADARNGGSSGCVEVGAFWQGGLHPDRLF